jgi:hypothetical protein
MQQNFSVSNTDVVTMLMVKQVAAIQEKLTALRAERDAITEAIFKRANAKYAKKLEEAKPYIEALTNLTAMYNPKLRFSLIPYRMHGQQIYYNIGKDGYYAEVHFDYIGLQFEYENEEMYKFCIEPHDGYYVPLSFKFKEKMGRAYFDAVFEIDRLQQLLDNRETLKEQIIAKVTEKALASIPELKELSASTLESLDL